MRGYAAIGLVDPKREANVGGALRAAHCFDVSLIILDGTRFTDHAANTNAAQRHVPVLVGPLLSHRPYDCPLIAVEIVPGAISLPAFIHPERALYVFGPENGSVPAAYLAAALAVVQIPSRHCLNLAAAVNVVLYDRLAKRGM